MQYYFLRPEHQFSMILNHNSHDVKIRYIPGKDPTMVFLNADNKVVLVSNHKVFILTSPLHSTSSLSHVVLQFCHQHC